jgi:hypothetical protein
VVGEVREAAKAKEKYHSPNFFAVGCLSGCLIVNLANPNLMGGEVLFCHF